MNEELRKELSEKYKDKLVYSFVDFGDMPIIDNIIDGKQVKDMAFLTQNRNGEFDVKRIGFLNRKTYMLSILKKEIFSDSVPVSSESLKERLAGEVYKFKQYMAKFEKELVMEFIDDFDLVFVIIQKDWDVESMGYNNDNLVGLKLSFYFNVAMINFL